MNSSIEVLNKINALLEISDQYPHCNTTLIEVLKDAKSIIEKVLHPWTTSSEEPPKEDGKYLVMMHEYGYIGFPFDEYRIVILTFKDNNWRKPLSIPEWIEDALTKDVIAWMPLPEPYEVKHEAD